MSLTTVLLDVEGTTTPVSFVYEVLFPYARARMEEFLGRRGGEPEVAAAVAGLRQLAREEGMALEPGAYALHLMDQDRKAGPLKTLQGLIWEDGYRRGELKGQLFAEVGACLEGWNRAGVRICIYSSGSVLAQKLLFCHSEQGDLTPLLQGYFDTAVGPKTSPESYREIASRLGLEPGQGGFATDLLAEAQAACQAGWQVVMMQRPGNAVQPEHSFPVLQEFTQWPGLPPGAVHQAL